VTENTFLAVVAIVTGVSWTTVKVTRAGLNFRTAKRRDEKKAQATS